MRPDKLQRVRQGLCYQCGTRKAKQNRRSCAVCLKKDAVRMRPCSATGDGWRRLIGWGC
jgi:hypothetical protein